MFTFAVLELISRGGHIGGLVAGAVLMLAFVQFRSSTALALRPPARSRRRVVVVAYSAI